MNVLGCICPVEVVSFLHFLRGVEKKSPYRAEQITPQVPSDAVALTDVLLCCVASSTPQAHRALPGWGIKNPKHKLIGC